jgi:hypothetical protein
MYNKISVLIGNSVLFCKNSKSFLYSFLKFLKKKYLIFDLNLINSYLGFYSYSDLIMDNNIASLKNLGFYYLISNDINECVDINNNVDIIIYQSFIKNVLYFKANLIFAATALYEFDSIYLNLEGKYRFIKQSIKAFTGCYND